jgi:hypothetical protein
MIFLRNTTYRPSGKVRIVTRETFVKLTSLEEHLELSPRVLARVLNANPWSF